MNRRKFLSLSIYAAVTGIAAPAMALSDGDDAPDMAFMNPDIMRDLGFVPVADYNLTKLRTGEIGMIEGTFRIVES